MSDTNAPKQLYELGPIGRECRFPVAEQHETIGGFLFCAKPVKLGLVYCNHHHDLSAVKGRPRGVPRQN